MLIKRGYSVFWRHRFWDISYIKYLNKSNSNRMVAYCTMCASKSVWISEISWYYLSIPLCTNSCSEVYEPFVFSRHTLYFVLQNPNPKISVRIIFTLFFISAKKHLTTRIFFSSFSALPLPSLLTFFFGHQSQHLVWGAVKGGGGGIYLFTGLLINCTLGGDGGGGQYLWSTVGGGEGFGRFFLTPLSQSRISVVF